jgi:hypothetical protein
MVDAMAQGHQAAEAIDAYIRGTKLLRGCGPADSAAGDGAAGDGTPPVQIAKNPRPDAPKMDRVRMPQADPAGRVRAFTEIDQGYSAEQAIAEAKRCLACGLCSE